MISETTNLPVVLVDLIILPYTGNPVQIQTPDGLVQQVWISTCENGNFFEIRALKCQEFCFISNPTLGFFVAENQVFCKWKDEKRGRMDNMNEKCCGYVIRNTEGEIDKWRINTYAINELTSCDSESIQGFTLGLDASIEAVCYTQSFIRYGFVYNFCAHCCERDLIYGPCFFCSEWFNAATEEDDDDTWKEWGIPDEAFEDAYDLIIETNVTEQDIWQESVTPDSPIRVCLKCFLEQKLTRTKSRNQIHRFLEKRPLYGQLNSGLECESHDLFP